MDFKQVLDDSEAEHNHHVKRVKIMQKYFKIMDSIDNLDENLYHSQLFLKDNLIERMRLFLSQKKGDKYVFNGNTRYLYLNTLAKTLVKTPGATSDMVSSVKIYAGEMYNRSLTDTTRTHKPVLDLTEKLNYNLNNRKTVSAMKMVCKLILHMLEPDNSQLIDVTLRQMCKTRVDRKVNKDDLYLDLDNNIWYLEDGLTITVPEELTKYYKEQHVVRAWLIQNRSCKQYADTSTISQFLAKSIDTTYKEIYLSIRPNAVLEQP